MHIPDQIMEKDLSLDELAIYARLLYRCQSKVDPSYYQTYHGGYDALKSDLLMDAGGQRDSMMEALRDLSERGLIHIERSPDGTWHITLLWAEVAIS